MSFEIKSKLEWNGVAAMADFDRENIKALKESAILVEGKAKEKVHVGKKNGGTLRQSITRLVKGITAYVGTPLEYAPHEEFGTRPHVILPKNKKYLSFMIGGKRIFTKKVNHPGTPAHPFLRPAFFSSIRAINNIFKKRYKASKYVD